MITDSTGIQNENNFAVTLKQFKKYTIFLNIKLNSTLICAFSNYIVNISLIFTLAMSF